MIKAMKKQDKELLLKDLCARLPYGVFANYTSEILFRKSVVGRVYLWSSNGFYIKKIDKYPDNWNYETWTSCEFGTFKPYLRPMSSMTEEERFEYLDFLKSEIQDGGYVTENYVVSLAYMPILIDWLNAHHFDFRGLIPMGLALPATEGMYDFK